MEIKNYTLNVYTLLFYGKYIGGYKIIAQMASYPTKL